MSPPGQPVPTAEPLPASASNLPARLDCVQIHLPDDWPAPAADGTPATLHWTWRSGTQTGSASGMLEAVPRARDCLLVIPGSRVLTVRTRLPVGRAARQPQVLGHAVEDMLAVAPDTVVVTPLGAPDTTDGHTVLAIVERAWLSGVLDSLALEGITPLRVTSDVEHLASQGPGIWSVVRQPHGGFVHLGGFESLPLDGTGDTMSGASLAADERSPAPHDVPLALQLLVSERRAAGKPPAELRIFSAAGICTPEVAAWAQRLALPVTDAGVWTPWPPALRAGRGLNLAAGLNRRPARNGAWLGAYRGAAAVMGAVLVGHLALTAIDNWRMAREITQLRDGMEARFRQMFPETRAIADPVLQMRRLYEARSGGSGVAARDDFLTLLAHMANPIAATGAQASAVRFEPGVLTLELSFAPGTSLDTIESTLKAEGFRATVDHVGVVAPPAGAAPGRTPTGRTTATIRVVAAP